MIIDEPRFSQSPVRKGKVHVDPSLLSLVTPATRFFAGHGPGDCCGCGIGGGSVANGPTAPCPCCPTVHANTIFNVSGGWTNGSCNRCGDVEGDFILSGGGNALFCQFIYRNQFWCTNGERFPGLLIIGEITATPGGGSPCLLRVTVLIGGTQGTDDGLIFGNLITVIYEKTITDAQSCNVSHTLTKVSEVRTTKAMTTSCFGSLANTATWDL